MNRFAHNRHHPPHHPHKHPGPCHDHRNAIHITLDEDDCAMLLTVLGNQDSAAAAEDIFYCEAPPEVRFLIVQNLKTTAQILRILQTMPEHEAEPAKKPQHLPVRNNQENRTRWNNPVLDDTSEDLFYKVYGEAGTDIHNLLEKVPYEMALVARIQAFLNERVSELYGHH